MNTERNEISLELKDLNIEDLLPLELDEEGQGHPENLASCGYCCTEASIPVLK